MTAAVETIGLTKRYGRIVAVRDVALRVESGEVYGFLGPNGAGKTTTLRMLLGLVRPSAGEIRRPPLARVGALIEGPAFYPFLSGRENLRTLARRARVPATRVADVLHLVRLTDRAGDRYRTYSLGMKQRLGLAAAMLKRPDLLVLDEPTNGLDPAGMADMRETIRGLANDGCTVLLSSHLLGEVRQICDRVGIINQGRLIAQQPIEELSGLGSLRVVAEPVDRAEDKVRRILGASAVRVGPGGLDVATEASMAPVINRALVAEGIAVHELRWQQPDLERVFLELTEGASDGV
jgi:ABC-2 type transport system ATP-binding protein